MTPIATVADAAETVTADAATVGSLSRTGEDCRARIDAAAKTAKNGQIGAVGQGRGSVEASESVTPRRHCQTHAICAAAQPAYR